MISERRVYLIGILTGRQEFILHTAVFTSLYTWIDKTRSWSSKSILCVIKVSTADHANNDKGNRNCRSCCHTYINRLGYFNESLSIKLNLKKMNIRTPIWSITMISTSSIDCWIPATSILLYTLVLRHT